MKLSLIEKLLYTVEFNVQISIIIIRDTIWFVRFVSWKYKRYESLDKRRW